MRLIPRLLVLGCVFATATSAAAQTKVTAKCSQGKPDPNHVIVIDDRPHHAMYLGKVTCTFSAGEVEGDALKAEVDTVMGEMTTATTSRDHGYGVGSTASGDKYYVRFDGTTTYKGENPTAATCTWTFVGGTGKLHGLTGKGTCTGTYDASGGATFDIVGEYSIKAK